MTQSPHDLAPAYALDALEGLQRFTFEAHLDHCRPCLGDVSDIRDASELLSVGVVETPPAALRSRVLAATEAAAPGSEKPVAPARAQYGESDEPREPRRRRWLGRG